jgi:beta-propeller uncharacterized protein DUF5122
VRTSRATRSTTALLILALAGGLLALPTTPALATAADFPDQGTWVTNGDVMAVTQVGSRTYLGGNFDQVGPNTGFGVPLNPGTGAMEGQFLKVNGDVYAAASDGAGGWFIGGNFTRVGECTGPPCSRHNAAHVKADGSLGPWNPNANFDVRSIAVDHVRKIIYIGGDFTQLGRDASGNPVSVTGLAATNWDAGYATALPTATGGKCAAAPPDVRTCVHSIALSPDGSVLYAGGTFTALGGEARNHLGAVNVAAAPSLHPFNPGTDNTVRTLAVAPDGSRVYVGGTFSTIAGVNQANLASVTPAGGIDPTWGPSASGGACSSTPEKRSCVATLLLNGDGSRLYVGGDFDTIGGQGQNRLAALNTAGGGSVDSSFDPQPGAPAPDRDDLDPLKPTRPAVSALALDGGRLYAAGSFGEMGGNARRFLAALDAGSGAVDLNFDPRPGATTLAVAVSGSRVYAGGLFTSVNGFPRKNMAAIGPDGTLDMGFTADADKQVNGIAADASGNLFIGGIFMKVNGISRHRVAKINAVTGALDPNWKPDVSSEVKVVAVNGAWLYMGGIFSTIGTSSLTNLARVNPTTGQADLNWHPNPDTGVYDIDFSPDGSLVYVAGSFDNIGGTSRKNIAVLSATTGGATNWTPRMPAGVPAPSPSRKIVVSADGARVFLAVAGGDVPGNRIQTFNTTVNPANPSAVNLLWDHKGDGDFTGLDISGSLVYAGGHFDNIVDLGQPRQHLAAFDQVTGAITPWGPSVAGIHGILDLEVNNTTLLIAGEFRRVTGMVQQGWARFANSPDGAPPTTATTLPPGVTTTSPGGGGGGGGGSRSGYWMVGSDGKVYSFGDAALHGGTPPLPAGIDAVDLEPTPSGNGYWIVNSAGQVYAMGDARYMGNVDPGRVARDEKATSLSSTKSGNGYWIFTNKGRVLTFGDATHYGDMAATRLNGPVLDSIPTASGRGYYMVASDGGIFSFGDAKFYGSMGDKKLNAPVQSLVPDGDGVGYWLVASDGGIFAFEAPFKGSMGNVRLNKPVTGMVRFGNGYLMVGEDGGIFTFTDKAFHGSLGNNPPARPVVSVAALG